MPRALLLGVPSGRCSTLGRLTVGLRIFMQNSNALKSPSCSRGRWPRRFGVLALLSKLCVLSKRWSPRALDLLQHLLFKGQLIDISICLIDGINDYITAAQNRLPWHHLLKATCDQLSTNSVVAVKCKRYDQFHDIRVHCEESQLILQLLMDRLWRSCCRTNWRYMTWISESVRLLTSLESNAIQYVARFVSIKLLKRIRIPLTIQTWKSNIKCLYYSPWDAGSQPTWCR